MSRSEEMHQCLLYDSTEKNAKLLGVEYIISDRLYRELPDEEKKYWHPHTYEVLAAGLIAGMKPEDELAFMKALLRTWGRPGIPWPIPRTPIPMGLPLLMWLTGCDEVAAIRASSPCDKQFQVSSEEISKLRVASSSSKCPGSRIRSRWIIRAGSGRTQAKDKPTRRE